MEDRLHEQIRAVGGSHWWYEGRRRVVESQLEHLLEPNPDRRILEIGCGSGSMLPLLARFGRVDGLDADAEAVEHCRRVHGAIGAVALGRVPDDLPGDGSYDLVAAFDVLEHVADDETALLAIRATLRPGGWLIATVPAFPSLWGQHDVLSHHHRRYRAKSLRRVVGAGGLEIERLTYFNTLLFPPIAAVRLAMRATSRLRSSRPEDVGSDLDIGPSRSPVARVLGGLFGWERHLLRRGDLPFGVSLLLAARRPPVVGSIL